MFRFLFVLILVTSFAHAVAQQENNGVVKGFVIDASSSEGLEYATISLYDADNKLVNGTISERKGKFIISKLQPGTYSLEINFLSFTSKQVQGIQIKYPNDVIDVGSIIVEPASELLKEIEVVGERSEMELGLDKKVFNVGKDLSNRGSNASEILDNVPSVNVDVEGNVSLRGSGNVRILIDGKPSGLVSNGGNALRQIQGDQIESIELITNPSAKYDAEGDVGIINIVMKKNRKKGANASFGLTTGWPHNYGFNTSVNWRKNTYNLFADYGLSSRKTPGYGGATQNFFFDDTAYTTIRNREHIRGGISNNLRVGADIFLTKSQTLTAALSYKISDENNNSTVTYKDYDSSDALTQTVVRTDDEREDDTDIEWSLNYEKKMSREDQKLTANVQYSLNREVESSFLLEDITSESTDTPLYQSSKNAEGERSFLAQVDYLHPFSKTVVLETGIKSSQRFIGNNYEIQEKDNQGDYQRLENLSNNFLYNESIVAGFAQMSIKTKPFSYQIGLRSEYTLLNTELKNTGEKNDNTYIDLFPSFGVAYEWEGSNSLQFNYSRRINRPRFWTLNPFFSFSDSRNFFSGNPNLKPEYTHSLEFGHLKYFASGSLYSGLYYRHTDDVIERITTVSDSGISKFFPINLSTSDAYGYETNMSFNFIKWLRSTLSANVFYQIHEGSYEGLDYSSESFSFSGRMSNKIILPSNFEIQANFNYSGAENNTQGKSLARYGLDMGVSKDLMKGKGTLTLSGRDVFNTQRRRNIAEGLNFYQESDFQWRSRQFLLSFSYRFNQSKKRQKNNLFEGEMDGGF